MQNAALLENIQFGYSANYWIPFSKLSTSVNVVLWRPFRLRIVLLIAVVYEFS